MKKISRTKPDDWIDAGFVLLEEGGEDELTIERLCKALRRTKGAFYHHYADIAALRTALLAAWEQRHTQAPIDVADAATASERRAALHAAVGALDPRLELAIRAWAHRDAIAMAACRAVDDRRVAYLQALWQHQGKAKALAARCAELEYATFLGLLTRHGTEQRKHRATYELLIRALAATS